MQTWQSPLHRCPQPSFPSLPHSPPPYPTLSTPPVSSAHFLPPVLPKPSQPRGLWGRLVWHRPMLTVSLEWKQNRLTPAGERKRCTTTNHVLHIKIQFFPFSNWTLKQQSITLKLAWILETLSESTEMKWDWGLASFVRRKREGGGVRRADIDTLRETWHMQGKVNGGTSSSCLPGVSGKLLYGV